MKKLITDLLIYNEEANTAYIELLASPENPAGEKGIREISHIMNAHEIWLARLHSIEAECGVWQVHSPDSLLRLNRSLFKRSTAYIASAPVLDLMKTISYQDTRGNSHKNIPRDIFIHICNHATYHRAKVAAMFAAAGVTPPSTDYIYHRRGKDT